MEPKLQSRIQRYGWDRAAPWYERFWSRQLEPAQRHLLEMADLVSGERVVEVACGTGLVTFAAAAAVTPSGCVLATDLSDAMVRSVRDEVERRGLDHVGVERRDAEELRVPPGSFDVALCALGLMYVPDPVRALREMRNALRPGGRAVAAVWGARRNCGWAEIFSIVDSRVNTAVCPLFYRLGDDRALAEAMEAAGFEDVRYDRVVTLLRYESGDDAVGAAFVGGPVALAYSRFDDATRAEAHAEYLASIAPYRNGNGYDIPGEFVIATGRRPGSGAGD